MRFFCPQCWQDFPEDVRVCPRCGTEILAFWRGKTYAQRLIAALRHPEPETAERAAWILGELREETAVESLMALVEEGRDVYIARAAVEALGKIGTPRAGDFLITTAKTHPVAMVRDAAKGATMKTTKSAAKNKARETSPLSLPLGEGTTRPFRDLVLDFNGTLSLDGTLLPGVADRLRGLAKIIRVSVLTADTLGKAADQLAGLPVQVTLVQSGTDKADIVKRLGPEQVIAIGNGRNDLAMMSIAGLSVAVMGPEGAAGEVLGAADVVVTDVHHALDLITRPMRLKAALRD